MICSAQHQGNIWYFGTKSGFDFSSGVPVPIYDGQTGLDSLGVAQEGTAVISDSTGQLLFYSSGSTVWNRNHEVMPNGSGLFGGESSTQSSLIVPKPGDDNLFYLFTTDEFQKYYEDNTQKGYRYTIIDMRLDDKYGDIIADQKNQFLADSSTEKIAACLDVAKTGYWIVGHKMFSNQFLAWHLTEEGLSAPVISNIGTIHGWNPEALNWNPAAALGQMKFNSEGTKLAVAIGNNQPAIVDLFDFDRSTGQVSNHCYIPIDAELNKRAYGVEFSPDGNKLYANVTGGSGGKRIHQYDLTTGDGSCASIISSRQTIFQSNSNSIMSGMQLGPDGKIYVVCDSYNSVGCINYPNLTGDAVEFDVSAVSVHFNAYTFPAFVAGYKSLIESTLEDTIPDGTIVFYPNPVNGIAKLKVRSELIDQSIEFRMYDDLGRLLYVKVIAATETDLDFRHLSTGVYFYKLVNQIETIETGKIVVE